MLLLPCTFCGPRPEAEFTCLGEATPPRPTDPQAMSDAAWVDYIVMRQNIRGVHLERWWHVRGCGAWLEIQRNTVTHAISAAPDAAESAP
ncbi:MAG: sarcosine oxidase subunit delta [Burkholderiaceae bacterium]